MKIYGDYGPEPTPGLLFVAYTISEIEEAGDTTYTYYGGKILLQKRGRLWYKRMFNEHTLWEKVGRLSWRALNKRFLQIEQISLEEVPLGELDELVTIASAYPTLIKKS